LKCASPGFEFDKSLLSTGRACIKRASEPDEKLEMSLACPTGWSNPVVTDLCVHCTSSCTLPQSSGGAQVTLIHGCESKSCCPPNTTPRVSGSMIECWLRPSMPADETEAPTVVDMGCTQNGAVVSKVAIGAAGVEVEVCRKPDWCALPVSVDIRCGPLTEPFMTNTVRAIQYLSSKVLVDITSPVKRQCAFHCALVFGKLKECSSLTKAKLDRGRAADANTVTLTNSCMPTGFQGDNINYGSYPSAYAGKETDVNDALELKGFAGRSGNGLSFCEKHVPTKLTGSLQSAIESLNANTSPKILNILKMNSDIFVNAINGMSCRSDCNGIFKKTVTAGDGGPQNLKKCIDLCLK